ncbi:Trigger factor [uncultured Clostridium sp.]|uniref:peptidylprolyl isomerase n=1 Tax=Muricoprocola aceti TaxID=2981772 RepID=A0ABT2SM40_9FIRM|nr:trigger factor [Muricoprocola aceti]MCU6725572.1 trigger factor [Muricoprocola aceti]SCH56586.1 Trigger factor [uncultured Clostridium sp.]
MKRKAVAALLACVALAATGCGSSEKETEKATEAATTEAASETETESESEAATTEAESESETESESEAATTEAESESEEAAELKTGKAAAESETESESETASETETESESETASETETESESETASETETESESETASETETESESETASETETESESETASETETESESETASETETESESENASETETGSEAESETGSEEESETETEFNVADIPEYDASEYVTLGEYKDLTVEVTPVEVTDEQVMDKIASETKQTLTEGTVESGDTVNIDYVGKIDEEEFDGGSAEGYDLEIGSCTFIDGFEDGIIGMQVGDTKDLELKFPEDYHSTDLAGKDVVFTVTVNSISRVPELTDEVADSVVEGMTAEAYQESVRQDLEDQAKESQKTEAEQKLLQAVYENATIDGYPEENLQYTIKRAKDYYEWLASMYGMSLDDYLKNYGMTQDEFNEQIQPVAEEALGEEMTLLAIAKEENIEVSDEEYEAGLARYAEAQGMDDPSKLEEAYGENYIKNSLLQEKVLEFLYENATIEEVAETEAESESESETEAASEVASEEETETETTSETETESESETASETETESETEA